MLSRASYRWRYYASPCCCVVALSPASDTVHLYHHLLHSHGTALSYCSLVYDCFFTRRVTRLLWLTSISDRGRYRQEIS